MDGHSPFLKSVQKLIYKDFFYIFVCLVSLALAGFFCKKEEGNISAIILINFFKIVYSVERSGPQSLWL